MFTQCITERYSSGGPQGDVLGYARINNPPTSLDIKRPALLSYTVFEKIGFSICFAR